MGFDLNEFSFGVVRNSVPTESRPEVLASWHRYCDPALKSSDILGDVWRMAALSFVVEGRNVPLYQYPTIIPYLEQPQQKQQVAMMEAALPDWIAQQDQPFFHFLFEMDALQPILFDLITDKWVYHIYYDSQQAELRMEDKILLLLKQYAYEEMYDRVLRGVAAWNMATGLVTEYEVTPTIREQISQMWQHLQQRYGTV